MRPKLPFVDTAGWIAQADAAHPDHARACAARDHWLESGGLLVSSDYVLDELRASGLRYHACSAAPCRAKGERRKRKG